MTEISKKLKGFRHSKRSAGRQSFIPIKEFPDEIEESLIEEGKFKMK